jgi:hypothetical protein
MLSSISFRFQTYLTISQRLPHHALLNFAMNSHGTSAQTLNRLKMSSFGGVNASPCIHVFRAWPLIIFQSQVSVLDLFLRSGIDVFSATSTDVERVFSQGRIVLSHIRNRLSAESTRALLCLGNWSLLGYVKDKDITAVTVLPELVAEEEELEQGWDAIE